MNIKAKDTSSDLDQKSLRRMVITRFVLVFIVLGLMFFLPAWTYRYWQAWAYMLILVVPMILFVRYLYKNDPELLKRRLRMREKQKAQRLVQVLVWPLFLLAFVIPGFDYRLHWSNMPLALVIISEVVVLVSYLFIGLVFRTNSYASRVVEVEKGQKVITTGPYAIVRHPMYLGVLFFYIFSPLSLGSYWALIPTLLIIPILFIRIRGEEKELLENLEGYEEYVIKTKYRLVPGIW